MEELKEKAKHSIVMKNRTKEESQDVSLPAANLPIAEHREKILNSDIVKSKEVKVKQEVSDNEKYNDSDSHKKLRKRRRHRRSSSSRNRKSRYRDSHRRRSKRRRSYSRSSSDDSEDRRRRRRRRRRSSSEESRGRHHHKYRRSRKSRRYSSSSSSRNSSSSGGRKERDSRASTKNSSHPYFSRLSKIRRERLNQERKEKFWDGFQWVSKESLELGSKDPTLHMKENKEEGNNGENKIDEKIVTGKDLRRVVATNLPLQFGIDQEDLSRYLIQKI